MEEIIGIAIFVFLIWLIIVALDFIIKHWQIFTIGAVIIALLPFVIGQRASFVLLRTPGYVVGVVLCILITPLDYAFLFLIEHVGAHALITLTRTIGAPFVVIHSAWFDREEWPSYLKDWKDAYDRINPDWECSGLMKPDTNLGGNLTTMKEVFHGKTTTYIFN